MAVSVATLWLIYFLVFLVVAIILSLPRLYVPHRTITVVLFAAIAAAITVTFIPADTTTDAAMMSYNSLLSAAYMLIVILIIIMAVSFANVGHRHHHRKSREYTVDASVTCDSDGTNCHTDRAVVKDKRGDRVRVTYR